jgi:hypothetical protein
VQINAVRMDDFLRQQSVKRIHAIKMDVQGAEGQALMGMKNTLHQQSTLAILTEFWPQGLTSAGTPPEHCLQLLLENNFQLHAIFEDQKTIEPLQGKARAIADEMKRQDKRLELFIQVNTGEEPQKAGVVPAELPALAALCRDELALEIAGLMCIPPLEEEPAVHFAFLEKLAADWSAETIRVFASALVMEASKTAVMDLIVAIAILNEPDLEAELHGENVTDATAGDLVENRRITWQYPPPGTPLTPPYVVLVAVEQVDTSVADSEVQAILGELVDYKGYKIARRAPAGGRPPIRDPRDLRDLRDIRVRPDVARRLDTVIQPAAPTQPAAPAAPPFTLPGLPGVSLPGFTIPGVTRPAGSAPGMSIPGLPGVSIPGMPSPSAMLPLAPAPAQPASSPAEAAADAARSAVAGVSRLPGMLAGASRLGVR